MYKSRYNSKLIMRKQAKDVNIVFKDKSNYELRVINETLKLPNTYVDSKK